MMKTASSKKITKKQIYKLIRKANRELELEGPGRSKAKIHKTSKKDVDDRKSNTVKEWE